MLSLREIVKSYQTGDTVVTALNGVSIDFRKSEFVSILGPSGCGKTTLLNVVGGLDRYDSGDLVINERSTKEYRDADWDTYRNHSVGFVFQSYNLITHQTVLANVELALTLSGVSREERRRRAIEALEQVGLGDQIHKRPNQMSGGQMQRVAIARALVNDPDILLADEPTGALDTVTSVQIMEILKKVSEKKLVVMVTHNPELAEEYSTRIIRLLDGEIISDTAPFDASLQEETATEPEAPLATEEVAPEKATKKKEKKSKKNKDGKGKRSMSFGTALTLSFNNLLTKKARTALVSVAGSIGIIGIALILALSNGVNLFIASVQENTLSSYPLTIQKETQDYSALLSAMTSVSDTEDYSDSGMIYVDDSLGTMMSAMSSTVSNDLASFKQYIEAHEKDLAPYVNDIRYTYDFDLQIFTADGKTQVNPTTIFQSMGGDFAGLGNLMSSSGMGSMSVMSEMIDNQELLDEQYELIGDGSHWPENANEVVLVVSSNNQISKMTLYMLGVLDQDNIQDELASVMSGNYDTTPMEPYSLDTFIGMKFQLLNTSDFFAKTGDFYTVNGVEYPKWYDMREAGLDQESFVTENGTELVISGIVRPKKGATATSISGALGYTKELTNLILDMNAKSEIIAQQKRTPHNSVISGAPFERTIYTRNNIGDLIDRVGSTNMERFYGIMTNMILQNPDYKGLLNVNETSIAMFIGTLESEELELRIQSMLDNAIENDYVVYPAMPPYTTKATTALDILFATIKSVPDGLNSVDITKENLIDLLPLLSDTQIMLLVNGTEATAATETTPAIPEIKGLKSICSEEYMTALYAEMNANMVNWRINEKSLTLLLSSPQMSDEMFATFESTLYDMVPDKDETYESMLKKLGDAEAADPASINFYAIDFESKDKIEEFIANYNDEQPEEKQLQYTDLVGDLMSSVTIIVNAISYVLIAFVSISLVVSSIMIGIITYISVLERTKEIGILRAIGASKRDISRVFNAETMIIGLAAGLIGVLFTVLVCIPITLILRAATGISTIAAVLPLAGAIVLVLISVGLTLLAGVIPSRIAAKKDPVEALRSE